MNRYLLVPLMVLTGTFLGCSKQPDPRFEFDSQVREDLPKFKRMDAIPFFESGGHYWNVGAEGEAAVDEQCVLPLMKALWNEAQTKSEVLVSEKDEGFAMRLLISVPPDTAAQARMNDLIARADEAFEGVILQQRGNDWLSLAFLDRDEVQLIRQKIPDAFDNEALSETATRPQLP